MLLLSAPKPRSDSYQSQIALESKYCRSVAMGRHLGVSTTLAPAAQLPTAHRKLHERKLLGKNVRLT